MGKQISTQKLYSWLAWWHNA